MSLKLITLLITLAILFQGRITFAEDGFYTPSGGNEVPVPDLEHIQILEDISTKNELNETKKMNLRRGIILPVVERRATGFVCMVILSDGTHSAPFVPIERAQILPRHTLPPILDLAESLVVSQSGSALESVTSAAAKFPSIRFFRAISQLYKEIERTEISLAQVPAMRAEADRIRRNADVIDTPSLLNSRDESGAQRAELDRNRANQMEESANAIISDTRTAVELQKAKITLISSQVLQTSQERAAAAKLIPALIQQQRDVITKKATDVARDLIKVKETTEKTEKATTLIKEKQRRESMEKIAQRIYEDFNHANEEFFEDRKREQASAGEAVRKMRDLDFYLGGGYIFQVPES